MLGPRRSVSALSFLKSLFLGLVSVALVLLAGIAASWPLWYLATKHATAYIVLLAVSALGLVVRSSYRRKKAGYS